MAKPTWLEAGPGRNWASATRSAKARSDEPAAPRDELGAEIAEMGDRPAERREAELEEGEEDLAGGGAPVRPFSCARLAFRHRQPFASAPGGPVEPAP